MKYITAYYYAVIFIWRVYGERNSNNYSEDRNVNPPVRSLVSTEVEYTLYISPNNIAIMEE